MREIQEVHKIVEEAEEEEKKTHIYWVPSIYQTLKLVHFYFLT